MTLYEWITWSYIKPDSFKNTEVNNEANDEWVIESFTHSPVALFETIYIGGAKIHKVIDNTVYKICFTQY